MTRPQRIIVGVSGATGVVYAVRLLETLRASAIETYLVVTKPGEMTLVYETELATKDLRALAEGQTLYPTELISPLVAFYRSAEKHVGRGPKVVYNLLPPEEWGDQMPTRASFAHACPKALQGAVIANWSDYGFAPQTRS